MELHLFLNISLCYVNFILTMHIPAAATQTYLPWLNVVVTGKDLTFPGVVRAY